MPFLIHQIMTILLAVHLGLGCCLHHAHTYATTCVAPVATTADACGCETHANIEGTSESAPTNDHNSPSISQRSTPRWHHCDGHRCSFVRSEPLLEQQSKSQFNDGPLVTTLFPVILEQLHSCQIVGSDHFLCGTGLPLCAHLLFRVLLI